MKRLAAIAGVTLALLASAGWPAHAAENAAVNGWARAFGAYVPASVNPNLDFWPVYSFSETDNSLSHGVSAGFWPGFLVDATFFQFGYQPFERAAFGVAESLWPDAPNSSSAGTSDFDKFCAAGQVSSVPLPADQGDAKVPAPLLSGCRAMYTQYRSYVPYEVTSGTTLSDSLRSSGLAKAAEVRLPAGVTVGSATSTSSTDANDGHVVSTATVILNDVRIGATLRIGQLRATASATSNGTRAGAKGTRSIEIKDATANGGPVQIGEDGVTTPAQRSLNEQLAHEGFAVWIAQRETQIEGAAVTADSSALVIRSTRNGPPPDVSRAGADVCARQAQLSPAPAATVHQDFGENPLYRERAPYDLLPPRLEVNETVPPSVPCLLLAFERSTDLGVVLGGATAYAGYTRLAAPPSFGDIPYVPDRTIFEHFGGGPGFGVGGLIPSFEEVPPVPRNLPRPVFAAGDLGPDVAQKVKTLYGGMALAFALLVGGRKAFRTLSRRTT
jgi:hypothetical protein